MQQERYSFLVMGKSFLAIFFLIKLSFLEISIDFLGYFLLFHTACAMRKIEVSSV